MYNNDVTYDKKWDTEENRQWQDKCHTYTMRCLCMSDVPMAWAKEVYELLQEIDKEFGIRYVINFHYGLSVRFSLWNSLFGPFSIWWDKPYLGRSEEMSNLIFLKKSLRHNIKKPKRFLFAYVGLVKRGYFMLKGMVYNRWMKPKVYVSQIKEKYGELVVYHSGPGYTDDFIEDLIADCEVKLARKGAYYPLESLAFSGVTRRLPKDSSIKVNCYSEEPEYEITDWRGRRALEKAKIDWEPFLKTKSADDNWKSEYEFDPLEVIKPEATRRRLARHEAEKKEQEAQNGAGTQ